MPEFSPVHASTDYGVSFSSLMSGPKRDNTLTMASDLFSLDPGEPVFASVSDASIASSPASFTASPSDCEPSTPFELHSPVQPSGNLADLLVAVAASPVSTSSVAASLPASPPLPPSSASAMGNEQLLDIMHSISASPAMAPTPQTPVEPLASVKPKLEPTQEAGLDYDSVCNSLKEMAATGTPATAMMSFLNLSRQALQREIPASTVLEGLLERERRNLLGAGPSSPPSLSSSSSFGGPHRRPRQSLREAASPYAIPAGPRMYQCDQCPLTFDRAYNLKEHLKTHDPHCNKRFPCPLTECPHASHRRADMHRHIKNVHMKKDGLTDAQKEVVLAAYPAMRPDLYPASPDDGWDQFKPE